MRFDLRRTARYYWLRFKRLQGAPPALAMGAAVGVFIGLTPTLPLHTVMIVGATILLRCSTIAGILAAALVSNPLTFALQYYLAWRIGNTLFPGRLDWERISGLLSVLRHSSFADGVRVLYQTGLDGAVVMLSGGVVLGLPCAVLAYFVSLKLFVSWQTKRRQRHLLNKR